MKKILLLAGVALALAACEDKEKEYDATGTFEATEVTVSAETSGKLKTFMVTEGLKVNANEEVGMVDTYQLSQKQDELDAANLQLEANAAATSSRQLDLQKQLASISQQIANARNEQARFAELVKDGAAPRKQLDDINYQIKVLKTQLDATRDQISANNASLAQQSRAIAAQRLGVDAQKRQLTDQIKNAHVVSPITGTVLEKLKFRI